ncbi:MAG TPA: DUF1707 domain-containing protein [Arachnia sp.]|nr:DUF1707 domain-containing protein [Arachnia sp.]HMR13957.1 DUF1707 domain-containing protein [Arachnia sp.]
MSELRPSFGERDKYLDLLSVAYADGRIDDEELERRTQAVLAAVTHKDAIAQFEGLPAPNVLPAPIKPAPPPPPKPASPPVLNLPEQPPSGPLYSIEPAPVRFTPAPRRSDDGPGAMIVKVVVGVAAATIGLTVIGGFISAGTAMNQFNQWGPGVVDIDGGFGPIEIGDDWSGNVLPETMMEEVQTAMSMLDREGWGSVVSLHAEGGVVSGTATTSGTSEVVSFASQADGSQSIGATAQTAVSNAVDAAEMSDGLVLALKDVEAELMGFPITATLAWAEDEPFFDVTFIDDGAEIDTARYDLAGNRVEDE